MCTGTQIPASDCFIFSFGGWNGGRSILARCTNGRAPVHIIDNLAGCEVVKRVLIS